MAEDYKTRDSSDGVKQGITKTKPPIYRDSRYTKVLLQCQSSTLHIH